jgi:hypothetical protein
VSSRGALQRKLPSAAHVTCGQQSLRDCPLRGVRQCSKEH